MLIIFLIWVLLPLYLPMLSRQRGGGPRAYAGMLVFKITFGTNPHPRPVEIKFYDFGALMPRVHLT